MFKVNFPKINFIGNKEKIAEWICDNFPTGTESLFDAFAGGGSISYEAKKRGLRIFGNDILKVNFLLSKALIENSSETLDDKDIEIIFGGSPVKGFMYQHYSNVYYFPKECMELDLYRTNIDKLTSEYKKALALSLMRRAMIRKMPYSRFNLKWEKIKILRDEEYSYSKYKRKRAYHNQSFQSLFLENLRDYNSAVFNNGRDNIAYNEDVFNLLKKIKTDIIYLDPPYTSTMNNYFSFYGAIDSYIKSEVVEPFRNNFIDKKSSLLLFDKLFSSLGNYRYWLLSYNSSSFPSKEQLTDIIKKYSNKVTVLEHPYAYKVTGKENKNNNKEYLFIIENPNFVEKYVLYDRKDTLVSQA